MIINAPGFWMKAAFLFLYRSRRSTSALFLMILSAVSGLIFLASLAVGTTDAMIRNSVSLFSGHISGIGLPESLKKETLEVRGVAGVLKRAFIPGSILHDDRVETITMIGVDPFSEWKHTAIWAKTVQGRYLRNNEATIFLSRSLARKLKVKTGSVLSFSPRRADAHIQLKVSGIYETGIDSLDRGIAFAPLKMMPVEADTWSAAVFLNSGVKPAKVLDEYARTFSESRLLKSWKDQMPDLRQLIDMEYISMGIVMVLVFGVVALGIACAFVIFILKNLREYGIMKTMGVTPPEITIFIVIEVLLMNLAASFIGIIVGIAAVFIVTQSGGINLGAFTSHNPYFAVSGIILPRLTYYSLGWPPMLSFVFSLAASIWPAILVARKNAAEILRIV